MTTWEWIGFAFVLSIAVSSLIFVTVCCMRSPQISRDEENELLQDALYHSGYDWEDCIDCGGPPHDEQCRFWKLRHLFPLWFEGQEEQE